MTTRPSWLPAAAAEEPITPELRERVRAATRRYEEISAGKDPLPAEGAVERLIWLLDKAYHLRIIEDRDYERLHLREALRFAELIWLREQHSAPAAVEVLRVGPADSEVLGLAAEVERLRETLRRVVEGPLLRCGVCESRL